MLETEYSSTAWLGSLVNGFPPTKIRLYCLSSGMDSRTCCQIAERGLTSLSGCPLLRPSSKASMYVRDDTSLVAIADRLVRNVKLWELDTAYFEPHLSQIMSNM